MPKLVTSQWKGSEIVAECERNSRRVHQRPVLDATGEIIGLPGAAT